jgi:serine/threonine protein kinase
VSSVSDTIVYSEQDLLDGPGIPALVPEGGDRPILPAPPRSRGAGSDLRPGQRVGRYVIESRIGTGGMGVVYGAMDPELGRRVALKVVRRPAAGEQSRYVERLHREALALARLDHANVVALYDVGTTGWGAFLAMEFLRGQSLRSWLCAQRRGWREIVEVFIAAGRGLRAAHCHGIVHRDFKPNNVVVCSDGRVKVLDFGLALGSSDVERTGSDAEDSLGRRMTRVNFIVGTTSYMSPEQLSASDVDHRADQFAFCVALWEALYGMRPYDGDTALELARAYERGEPRMPPTRAGVSRRVHEAMLRGLEIDPRSRWSDMDALLAELVRPRVRWVPALTVAAALAITAAASVSATLWWTGQRDGAAAAAAAPDSCDEPWPGRAPQW